MSEMVENKARPIGAGPVTPVRKTMFSRWEKLTVAGASILVCAAMLSVAVGMRVYAAF